jgi:hypothetical protein
MRPDNREPIIRLRPRQIQALGLDDDFTEDLGIGSTVALVALDDGTVDSAGATRHNEQDHKKADTRRNDVPHFVSSVEPIPQHYDVGMSVAGSRPYPAGGE